MFNKQLLGILSKRLDTVEEHVAQCAKQHELDGLKADLKDNRELIGEIKDNTNRLAVEFSESRRWIGIIAGLLAFFIPFIEEVKDVIFHQDGTAADIQYQNEVYYLRKELEELKKQ